MKLPQHITIILCVLSDGESKEHAAKIYHLRNKTLVLKRAGQQHNRRRQPTSAVTSLPNSNHSELKTLDRDYNVEHQQHQQNQHKEKHLPHQQQGQDMNMFLTG